MKKLTEKQESALNQAAAAIGIPAQWLRNQIQEESGFNPAARNPYTNATGLIQFMPATARGLGYKDENDLLKKHKTIESQLLNPVIRYYKQFPPAPKTEQEFYMMTFYPAWRYKPLDTVFPDYVKKVNPGVNTIRDFVNRVRRAGGSAPLTNILSTGLILAIAAGAIFFYAKMKQKDKAE